MRRADAAPQLAPVPVNSPFDMRKMKWIPSILMLLALVSCHRRPDSSPPKVMLPGPIVAVSEKDGIGRPIPTASPAGSQQAAPNVISFVIGDGQTPRHSTHYYAIAAAVDEDAVSVVSSLDEYLPQAQAVFRNAVPTGETKKYRDDSYSGVNANASKMAFIDTLAAGPSKYIPAAGLPGVKTFVEINSSNSNPLRIAENLEISQGAFFFDGEVFFIRAGSSYRIDKETDSR